MNPMALIYFALFFLQNCVATSKGKISPQEHKYTKINGDIIVGICDDTPIRGDHTKYILQPVYGDVSKVARIPPTTYIFIFPYHKSWIFVGKIHFLVLQIHPL